ncbi:MAG: DUF2076 domain-containing protein [Hyphomicrobiales bacterium]|nr:DUF2076 domain-containing protein [Hyphomicrobiales bacterium]
MTPEERNLITQLFDRLSALEDAPRDSEAERAIRDGLQQAPNAVYALVQTVLVQDQALRAQEARLRELEPAAPNAPAETSFLSSMRDNLFGRSEPRGSVPSVRPGSAPAGMSPAWGGGAPGGPTGPAFGGPGGAGMAPGMASGMGMGPGPMGGGSFLGTAAATAAGVIGGSLLMGALRNATAGESGHRAFEPQGGGGGGASPWGGGGDGGGLARQAGLDDIGRGGGGRSGDSGRGHGIFDDSTAEAPYDDTPDDMQDDTDFGDDGGFDLGGSDE